MYEYRVYTLIQKNFNQGRVEAYGDKKQRTYGLPDWFKVGQDQLKGGSRRKKKAYVGFFEPKPVTMSA